MSSSVRLWRKQQDDASLLGKRGTIVSWTEIFVAPPKFSKQAPYTIVLVELENSKKVYGQLVDFDLSDRQIGKQVSSVLRRNGEVDAQEVIEYGVKFKPVT